METYKLNKADIEFQLMQFAAREIRFRVDFLRDTYNNIAAEAGVSGSTVAKLGKGRTKHPQARTLLPILLVCGFEFDVRHHRLVAVPNVRASK